MNFLALSQLSSTWAAITDSCTHTDVNVPQNSASCTENRATSNSWMTFLPAGVLSRSTESHLSAHALASEATDASSIRKNAYLM